MNGRAWLFGDDIDTDRLAPGHAMKLPAAAMARFCLETVDPHFAGTIKPGDLVIAGRNFGMGSAREQAAAVLVTLGVGAVIAHSFARIFYRNAINLGLPVLVRPESAIIAGGDLLDLDWATGILVNFTRGDSHALPPLAPHLAAILRDGGLIPHLKRRLTPRGTK